MTEIAVSTSRLGKMYRLYERPGDRLRSIFGGSRHHEFWALRDFDFEVKRGESVGVVGANGAGKSTLLKLLAKKLRPTTGEVAVNGRVSSILELGTGFQMQLTGRQNARVNALFLGRRPWEIEGHVDKIIEFAEIGEHADQPLSTYSSGMQSRLAFAALTTLDPEILLLDEALATGDARFAAKCNEYLRKLCRSGCTTLVASHDFWFLASTCDRIVWIEKGKKRADGAPGEVLQRYLDALGQDATTTAGRPANALLKIEAADPATDPTFAINSFSWLDREGTTLGEHHIGQQDAWNAVLDLAPKFGLSPERARRGWGRVELVTSSNSLARHCAPGRDGVFVTLPIPVAPRPVPAQLRVTIRQIEPCDAVFSLQVDGAYREIGRAGQLGRPGTGIDWTAAYFDVATAFAPPTAGGAPA